MNTAALIDKYFSCEDIYAFLDLAKNEIFVDSFGLNRFFRCEYHKIPFMLKIAFQRISPVTRGESGKNTRISHVEAEIKILTLIREKIIKKNYSPAFVEILHVIRCPGLSKITITPEECKRVNKGLLDVMYDSITNTFCEMSQAARLKLCEDTYTYIAMEHCNHTLYKLLQYAGESNEKWLVDVIKSAFFVILHGLYVIKALYPSFLHDDLHLGNIMFVYDSEFNHSIRKTGQYCRYYVDGVSYDIPFYGLYPKIIDFGFSRIDEIAAISEQQGDKWYSFISDKNDVTTLLARAYRLNSGFKTRNSVKIMEFLGSLDPQETYLYVSAQIVKTLKPLIAKDILLSRAFSKYRTLTPKKTYYKSYDPLKV